MIDMHLSGPPRLGIVSAHMFCLRWGMNVLRRHRTSPVRRTEVLQVQKTRGRRADKDLQVVRSDLLGCRVTRLLAYRVDAWRSRTHEAIPHLSGVRAFMMMVMFS